ncbi:MAG: peptidase [Thaumarchaeota archaeon]|nr:peptidase [Nitrososphaerota archaeon]
MKSSPLVVSFFVVLILGSGLGNALAQLQAGGVNKPGDWYVGEGLKIGDQFSYKLCYVDYKECAEFQIDFWISGEKKTGTEEKWVAQTVVYDGNKIVKGEMELGKVAPEPTGGSPELSVYRGAFKSSIVWLSAYATNSPGDASKGPKKFSAPSWGKIGNIGGEQIIPTALETITVPEGKFETVLIQWKTGGYFNNVWIVDDFPFPIKASTWAHVAEGIPPQEYRFELLDYKQNVKTDPYSGIISSPKTEVKSGCPQNYNLVEKKGNTKQFTMIVEVKFGPPKPVPGCQIEWFINFKNKYDNTEFLNQVHYDILVVDDKMTIPPLRTLAGEEGRAKFYTTAGQVHQFTTVKEKAGTAHYVIYIYGTNPEQIIPPVAERDFFTIDIPISGQSSQTTTTTLNIPKWIKTNAGFWANGQITDQDFVSGIQYLINQKIMKIPSTTAGSGTGTNVIPKWIKTNAGFWANGQITDQDFVSGIQYLITNGILKIKS